jgi:hypothetical protein
MATIMITFVFCIRRHLFLKGSAVRLNPPLCRRNLSAAAVLRKTSVRLQHCVVQQQAALRATGSEREFADNTLYTCK